MRVTSKGQVTIPADIRYQFGFLANTEVEFVVEHGAVHVVLAGQNVQHEAGEPEQVGPTEEPTRGKRGDWVVARLRGRGRGGMSTDEILALTRQP